MKKMKCMACNFACRLKCAVQAQLSALCLQQQLTNEPPKSEAEHARGEEQRIDSHGLQSTACQHIIGAKQQNPQQLRCATVSSKRRRVASILIDSKQIYIAAL